MAHCCPLCIQYAILVCFFSGLGLRVFFEPWRRWAAKLLLSSKLNRGSFCDPNKIDPSRHSPHLSLGRGAVVVGVDADSSHRIAPHRGPKGGMIEQGDDNPADQPFIQPIVSCNSIIASSQIKFEIHPISQSRIRAASEEITPVQETRLRFLRASAATLLVAPSVPVRFPGTARLTKTALPRRLPFILRLSSLGCSSHDVVTISDLVCDGSLPTHHDQQAVST